jgi:hypothetical protein
MVPSAGAEPVLTKEAPPEGFIVDAGGYGNAGKSPWFFRRGPEPLLATGGPTQGHGEAFGIGEPSLSSPRTDSPQALVRETRYQAAAPGSGKSGRRDRAFGGPGATSRARRAAGTQDAGSGVPDPIEISPRDGKGTAYFAGLPVGVGISSFVTVAGAGFGTRDLWVMSLPPPPETEPPEPQS